MLFVNPFFVCIALYYFSRKERNHDKFKMAVVIALRKFKMAVVVCFDRNFKMMHCFDRIEDGGGFCKMAATHALA